MELQDVIELGKTDIPIFPKYASQIINLANQVSKGTRPNVVGQMSDLIQEFDGKCLNEWIEWYSERYPDNIDTATDMIYDMIEKFRNVIMGIDRDMVNVWVKNLVYDKTYYGLKTQQVVIEHLANKLGKEWRLATREEESKNIDGFIGNKPIQVKSITYKTEKYLNQDIKIPIVFYNKNGMNIELECDGFDMTYFE